MKEAIVNSWDYLMDSRYNPLRHMDLASQHVIMQALGWMWSMVFSLSFLSIFHFGAVWGAHLLLTAGVCLTVATFKQAERQSLPPVSTAGRPELSHASMCPWKLDQEA